MELEGPRYGGTWPDIPTGLARYLRDTFPRQCFDPTSGETLEEHLVYSGQVRLAEAIIAANAEQAKAYGDEGEGSYDEDTGDIKFSDGEADGERHVFLKRP